MYRLAAARAAGTRTLSTASGAPPAAAAGPKSAPPPPPPPAPSGFPVRRLLFLGVGIPFVAIGVRMHTNDEFRAYVDAKLPGASGALSKITGAEYTAPADAESESAWPSGSTLPPHFETVPEILSKIEKSTASTDQPPQRLTPSQRAAARSRTAQAVPDSSPKAETTVEKVVIPVQEAAKSPAMPAEKAPEPNPVAPVSPPPATPQVTPAPALRVPEPSVAPDISQEVASSDAPSSASSNPPADVQDAKTKIARVLGKPSEDPSSPFEKKGKVIDESVYRKPDFSEKKQTPLDVVAPAERAEKALAEVHALRRDLENQAQWDAVRVQKAVYAQLLEDKKVAAKEAADMARKHVAALERVKDEAMKNTEKVLEIRTREIEVRTAERRDRELKEMLAAREVTLRTELEVEFFEREREQAVARERALAEGQARVSALASHFDKLLEHNKMSRQAAQTSAAAFALCDAIATNRPFGAQMDVIAAKTKLAAAVAKSIPRTAQDNGIPTTQELQRSFATVSRRGLGAALVPQDAAGTIWGHILGAVMSRLKIRLFDAPIAASADFDEPTSDEDRIRQAQAYVEAGKLDRATAVLKGLQTPLATTILSDWLADARARCAADQAATVLFADATIAQVALATTPPKHPAA